MRDAVKQLQYENVRAQVEREKRGAFNKVKEFEVMPGTDWAKHFYPNLFTRPFASYQEDFWNWVDEIEPDRYYRPRIECEPRGVGKSTNAETAVVKLVAQKKRRMIGYVSLTEEKAGKHFSTIKSMLESDKLLSVYPHCKPKVQKLRDTAESWSRDAIVTDSDAMIVPLTLLGSSRGWKSSSGARFDFIVLDDIDALGQSPDFTKKLIELLKGEILAAGDDNTVVLMPQNLIYRDSICTQILDHRADILSDRIFCGAYPLLKWYDAEKIDLMDGTGAKKWIITAGEPFDNAVPVEYAERLLNKFGKATFDRECQQKVFEVEEDKDFREWNEQYHVITVSEFRRVMEDLGEPVWNLQRNCLQIPARWNVGIGFDWGTTRKHPSGVAFVARPSEMSPFKDCHFVFGEVIAPKFPLDSFETPELVSPGRVAEAIKQFLKQWNVAESQIKMRLMSHEASAALATMAIDLKPEVQQFFAKWKAKNGSGVPQIQNLLEIDHSKPHPFRHYPKGVVKDGVNLTGKSLQGRPRLYFIVADGQGELGIDLSGELFVIGAKDSKGFARARFEMPLYSHKNAGKDKIDDDFVDGFRGLMNLFGVDADSLTSRERVEKVIAERSPSLTYENMHKNSPYEKGFTATQEMARREEEWRIRKALKIPKEKPFEDEADSLFTNGGW